MAAANGIVCAACASCAICAARPDSDNESLPRCCVSPLETFRTWDSGRRAVPALVLQRARSAVAQHTRLTELVPLAP